MARRALTLTIDGDKVREHRERLGLEQADLARRCGISQSFLSRIESGQRNPSPRFMHVIAHHMGLKLDAILATAEPEPEAVNQ